MNKNRPMILGTAFILIISLVVSAGIGSASTASYTRTLEEHTIPNVTLVNQDGKQVKLESLVNCGRPVVIDFIFATCTTICPVLSAGYSNFQKKMGADASKKIQLISISIDPENDSPKTMKEYLKRFRAEPGWEFLTGTRKDIDQVMAAFDAYIPDKMSHKPLMFFRAPGDKEWVRIYGLIGTSAFISEYEKVAQRKQ